MHPCPSTSRPNAAKLRDWRRPCSATATQPRPGTPRCWMPSKTPAMNNWWGCGYTCSASANPPGCYARPLSSSPRSIAPVPAAWLPWPAGRASPLVIVHSSASVSKNCNTAVRPDSPITWPAIAERLICPGTALMRPASRTIRPARQLSSTHLTAKFISRARKLRFELQAKLGRQVTIEEVAGAIGVHRRVVMKFERNEMQRIDRNVIEGLAAYYHSQGIDATHLFEIDLTGIRTPSMAAT